MTKTFKVRRGLPKPRNLKSQQVFDPMYGELVEFNVAELNHYVKNGDLKKDVLAKIVNEFDPALYKPIYVGKLPNGELWIYDGCHRATAAEYLQSNSKTKLIKGYLKDVSSMAEIADLYYRHNDVRPKTSFEKWIAQVERGNPPHVRMNESMTKWGFRIGPSNTSNAIASLSTLESIEQKYGIRVFDLTMEVERKAFDGIKGSLKKTMIVAIASFLWYVHTMEEFDMKGYVKRLKKENPELLIKTIEAKGKRTEVEGVEVMLGIYNYRRTKQTKLIFSRELS